MRLTSTGSATSVLPAWDVSASGYPRDVHTHDGVPRWALATEMVRYDTDLMLLDNFR